MENLVIETTFWRNKRVLVTGHTGFKGSWLSLLLTELGAKVSGYALAPNTQPNLYNQLNLDSSIESTIADIRDAAALTKTLKTTQPEIIIHMAAQPLVLESYRDPVENYGVNVMGTVSLLDAARRCASVKSIVVVTTDKCYQNNQDNRAAFSESMALGGDDPYSSSKACCEILARSFYRSFFADAGIGVATARAGNVIGGGDWADARLIPDLIRSIEQNRAIELRYPNAVRPWQHVLEALSGYLTLAKALYQSPSQYSEAWNFGPDTSSVATVSDVIAIMQSKLPNIKIDQPQETPKLHEAGFLMLDSTKAYRKLGWSTQWDMQKTLDKVVDWYDLYMKKGDLLACTKAQINEYL